MIRGSRFVRRENEETKRQRTPSGRSKLIRRSNETRDTGLLPTAGALAAGPDRRFNRATFSRLNNYLS